jgi:hypothetical protein
MSYLAAAGGGPLNGLRMVYMNGVPQHYCAPDFG